MDAVISCFDLQDLVARDFSKGAEIDETELNNKRYSSGSDWISAIVGQFLSSCFYF